MADRNPIMRDRNPRTPREEQDSTRKRPLVRPSDGTWADNRFMFAEHDEQDTYCGRHAGAQVAEREQSGGLEDEGHPETPQPNGPGGSAPFANLRAGRA